MATPREIVASWDAKEPLPAAATDARPPTGYIIVDGARMAYWLPPGVSLFKPLSKAGTRKNDRSR